MNELQDADLIVPKSDNLTVYSEFLRPDAEIQPSLLENETFAAQGTYVMLSNVSLSELTLEAPAGSSLATVHVEGFEYLEAVSIFALGAAISHLYVSSVDYAWVHDSGFQETASDS